MSTPLSRRKLLKTLGLSLGAVLPLSAWAENEFGEALIIPLSRQKTKVTQRAHHSDYMRGRKPRQCLWGLRSTIPGRTQYYRGCRAH